MTDLAAHPYDAASPDRLRHADSTKWTFYDEDVLPMWVADMDFPVAEPILTALRERLTRSIGYAQVTGDPVLKTQLIDKLERDGLIGLTPEGVSFLPGVVPGLYAAVQALTQPGDEIMTVVPIYPPFLSAITDHGRVLNAVPLTESQQGWTLDMDALEAAVTPRTKLLMLCHPHNPAGRVWTRAELEQMADLALKHGLYVVSDELHADLRYPDAPEYVPFAAVRPELAQRVVTLTGPCKAYNTAGLGIGAMISHNPELVAQLEKATKGIMGHASALSITMWQTALSGGAEWLAETLKYLQANRDFLSEFMARELPDVPYTPPQATYLAWFDLRNHPRAADIQNYLLEEGKLALNDGLNFGAGYQGFVRLNFATSRELLQEGLTRLARAVRG
ncbi:pyridoxal phosphate-dependent aminotransferase [Deinococcus rubellus]|uniref:cysteine-S-conjugate beta-lyase n=1 Tax=Deinococcus rubellus TaxID=1889240 RepID=A0ABY5YEA0_9DEIO|nr:MalY/PatB family protein [Deinococcus rubellus]UWX63379.1 pyridoxal phosphate-dependent aminotransferase [Deinococcus rubellus]